MKMTHNNDHIHMFPLHDNRQERGAMALTAHSRLSPRYSAPGIARRKNSKP